MNEIAYYTERLEKEARMASMLTDEELDVALQQGAQEYFALYEAAYQRHRGGEWVVYPNREQTITNYIAKAAARKVVECITPDLDKALEMFKDIRGDWTNPRAECEAGASAIVRIQQALRQGVGL